MKKALIIGCEGQDGLLLYDLLYHNKYQIIGIGKNFVKSNFIIDVSPIDILNKTEVERLIDHHKPDEVYYLAAFHHSSEDNIIDNYDLYLKSFEVNVYGLVNFLEAIKIFSIQTKLFYASSSLIFGGDVPETQTEKTSFNPESIYGISKLCGLFICRYYRTSFDVFASVGILYNHESHLRKNNFLSKKIVSGVINIVNKKLSKLTLGDLDAEIDWGYAPDFVDAMHRILLLDHSDDFIVATGQRHSVKDFVSIAFSYFGLNWQDFVEIDKSILSRRRNILIGDATKLIMQAKWRSSVSFEEMIKLIIVKSMTNNE